MDLWRRGREWAKSFQVKWMALANNRSRQRPGRRLARSLGILVDEGGLLVSEWQANRGDIASGRTVGQAVRFTHAPGNGLEHLPGAAAAFVGFLKQHGFASRRAVFGLPARHLMLLRHELPAADAQTTASALWLYASTALPPELGKTSFDFLSDTHDPQLQHVTIVGLQQPLADRLRDFCKAAGLLPDCAMPTSFALAQATGRTNGNALILHRRESTAELLVQVDHLPRLLRSVSPATLPSELRRASAQLPAGARKSFVVWDDAAPDSIHDDLLATAAGMPLTRPDANESGLATYGVTSNCNLMMAALSDATAASGRPCIDLFHPRIIEPPAASAFRGRSLAMAAALIVLIALGVGWFDLQHLSTEAEQAQANFDALQPEVRRAKPLIQRLEYLSTFSAAQPRYLACLRDLTEAIEAIASVHLDHFDLNQAMQGSCSGQAAVEKDALELVDRLDSSKRFLKVNCKLDTVTSSSEGEKVTFRIAFGYLPAD